MLLQDRKRESAECLMATFTAVTSRVGSPERSNWGGLAIARRIERNVPRIHQLAARAMTHLAARLLRWD
jgi:hypothetical protein